MTMNDYVSVDWEVITSGSLTDDAIVRKFEIV